MTSGYTDCACRDCFETVVSNDMAKPGLCDDCHIHECGAEDGECLNPTTYNAALYESR